jgi:NADP-dependent 3-hydroxy acid dehydrogenase YdfG
VEIAGSSCIITGASSGIGAATARRLHALGASVTLAARRTERLQALADELPGSRAVTTDVTDPEQLARLVAEALAAFGRVDVLVNNAGQGLHVPVLELDPVDLRAVFELNVVASLVAMQYVVPVMARSGGGAVVNVSSATTLHAFPGVGGYAATKAALTMLSDVGRLELADRGVVVSVVFPRVTDTEFHTVLRAGSPAPGLRRVPKDPPDLVARAIELAITTGAAHVLVGDEPRVIAP